MPPASGAASALGFLAAPLSFEPRRSIAPRRRSPRISTPIAVNALLGAAGSRGPRQLRDAGVAEAAMTRRAQRRHAPGRPDAPDLRAAARRRHRRRAACPRSAPPSSVPISAATPQPFEGARIEAVNFRVRVRRAGAGSDHRLRCRRRRAVDGEALKGSRRGWFDGAVHDTPVYDRYASGQATASPAPPSSRNARRPPSSRPATRCASMPALNLRIAVGVAGRRGRSAVTPGMAAPRSLRAHRGRSDRARDHVVAAGHRRRGDVADRLPHRLFADHLRGAGFRLRTARPAGRHAGAFAARHAGVQPDLAARRQGAAGALSRRRR